MGSSLSAKNGNGRHARGNPRSGNGKLLEDAVVGMAKQGKLARPASSAVRSLLQRGISVTFRRGRKIILKHADGREEVLGTIKQVKYVPPPGVGIIERE